MRLLNQSIKAVIFDFDYTLADSSKGIIECINYALKELGINPVTDEVACKTIGFSLGDTFVELTGINSSELKEAFIELFVKRADEIMVKMTSLFENVPNSISSLRKKGLKLGIVSTKFRSRIEAILEEYGMAELFDIIIGGEDVLSHKPDPEGLNMAIEKLELHPSDVLYVGDSIVDAETAWRAGTSFAAVLSGVTKREAFLKYCDCRIYEKLEDSLEFIIDGFVS